ncbi:MAG: ferritin-like domain-containing protein, partial [Trueperaceae bacterium]|nr:ferritin-like domain-containing protein [Trueperaceae bacterium]
MQFNKVLGKRIDRRTMISSMGVVGAGALLTACGVRAEPEPPMTDNVDAAILTFALNLEYLEAGFYLAAVGRINELKAIGGNADIILPDGVEGTNPSDAWSDGVREFANELAEHELAHVKFLRSALGDVLGVPVADRPTLNFSGSFAAAAEAAGILAAGEGAAFNPYANELFFLHGTFVFEDVGVTAYNGAAPFVTNKPIVLQNAAGILAVEAYHSGAVRHALYM